MILCAAVVSLFTGLLLAPAALAGPGPQGPRPVYEDARPDHGNRAQDRDGPWRSRDKCFSHVYRGMVSGDGRWSRTPYSVRFSWCTGRNGKVTKFASHTTSGRSGRVHVSATTIDRGAKYRVTVEARSGRKSERRVFVLNDRGDVRYLRR